MQINFSKALPNGAMGRNGLMKTLGVTVHPMTNHSGAVALIQPVNTRTIGNCFIEVPVGEIDAVIAALTKVKAAARQ